MLFRSVCGIRGALNIWCRSGLCLSRSKTARDDTCRRLARRLSGAFGVKGRCRDTSSFSALAVHPIKHFFDAGGWSHSSKSSYACMISARFVGNIRLIIFISTRCKHQIVIRARHALQIHPDCQCHNFAAADRGRPGSMHPTPARVWSIQTT